MRNHLNRELCETRRLTRNRNCQISFFRLFMSTVVNLQWEGWKKWLKPGNLSYSYSLMIMLSRNKAIISAIPANFSFSVTCFNIPFVIA